MASQIHANGVGSKESEIELSEPVSAPGSIERGPPCINGTQVGNLSSIRWNCGPQNTLDNAGGLPRGMEGSICKECDNKNTEISHIHKKIKNSRL